MARLWVTVAAESGTASRVILVTGVAPFGITVHRNTIIRITVLVIKVLVIMVLWLPGAVIIRRAVLRRIRGILDQHAPRPVTAPARPIAPLSRGR